MLHIGVINPLAARIRAPFALMRQIAAAPDEFRRIESAQSAFTFAKLYYRGAGYWYLSGYAYDGSDVSRVLDKLRRLANSTGAAV